MINWLNILLNVWLWVLFEKACSFLPESHTREILYVLVWGCFFPKGQKGHTHRSTTEPLGYIMKYLKILEPLERMYSNSIPALGLAIHFKIYPIIFSLPMYLALTDQAGIRGLFQINSARFRLVTGTVLTLTLLTGLFYHLYGMPFLQVI